jgi:MSHA biogenesis protein MshP
MLITPPENRSQKGFALVSAIFILIALAALGGFIATVSSMQHIGSALDLNGARAYQAARAGTEWGVAGAVNASACAASTNIGTVNTVTVTVLCTTVATGNTVEVGLGSIYQITAIACNQPAAGICPGVASGANYVERRLVAIVER